MSLFPSIALIKTNFVTKLVTCPISYSLRKLTIGLSQFLSLVNHSFRLPIYAQLIDWSWHYVLTSEIEVVCQRLYKSEKKIGLVLFF